jgi:hypothetical protein
MPEGRMRVPLANRDVIRFFFPLWAVSFRKKNADNKALFQLKERDKRRKRVSATITYSVKR